MTLWAVLPVKPLKVGKSRLHSSLTEAEIVSLNTNLFESTYKRLQACSLIDRILVISKDAVILERTEELGGVSLLENEESSLNAALVQAQNYILETDPGEVLIVPVDLPMMETRNLYELIQMKLSPRCAVVVPDIYQLGTNALYLSEPLLIKPKFGRQSFQKHTQQALNNCAEVVVWLNKNIQSDLDTPRDLLLYNKINVRIQNNG
ncbi:MAG TPA: 2-phospho-L-lactate guanylyltransferase [Chloroflexi bacterium]|jgi:2-phospho-L-lactate guanylyltransferase|nr:2-phospho-L-lactate guanylyltransferase [Chloroflexota bacterium]